MSSAHKKALFEGQVKSFDQRGFIETTAAKAKELKKVLQSQNPNLKIHTVKMYNRKGDNAAVVRVISGNYLEKLNTPKSTGKNAKNN